MTRKEKRMKKAKKTEATKKGKIVGKACFPELPLVAANICHKNNLFKFLKLLDYGSFRRKNYFCGFLEGGRKISSVEVCQIV